MGSWGVGRLGSVVEARNRFQVVPGATVEVRSTTYKYDNARQSTIHAARLFETAFERELIRDPT